MATLIEPRVMPITPAVGAVIEGVDIGGPLGAETIAMIRKVLVERGVVFFRRQDITIEQLWDFIARFGTPHREDSFGSDDDTAADVPVTDLSPTRRGTAIWHTDSSFLAEPPKLTILRAVKLPPLGGDTCWSSMTEAYDALPEPLRVMLDKLSAVHTVELPVSRLGDYGDAFDERFRSLHAPHQLHPVVAVHPETGRKALYVTESCTSRIAEFDAQQSRHILALLFEHIKSPDFNLRWRWTEGDVALWDNRTVQHYAVPDYEAARVMQRIIIKGERPRGV